MSPLPTEPLECPDLLSTFHFCHQNPLKAAKEEATNSVARLEGVQLRQLERQRRVIMDNGSLVSRLDNALTEVKQVGGLERGGELSILLQAFGVVNLSAGVRGRQGLLQNVGSGNRKRDNSKCRQV